MSNETQKTKQLFVTLESCSFRNKEKQILRYIKFYL